VNTERHDLPARNAAGAQAIPPGRRGPLQASLLRTFKEAGRGNGVDLLIKFSFSGGSIITPCNYSVLSPCVWGFPSFCRPLR
jgi:hypothetical protein